MNEEKQIPQFNSYEEEAAFWDTHDVSDYWDQLKPVKIKYARKPTKPINVRFDDSALSQIQAIAVQRGVGTTTLIRMWTLEKLRDEKNERYIYISDPLKQDTSFLRGKKRK